MGRWAGQEMVPDRSHVANVVPLTRRGRVRPVVQPSVFDHELEQRDEVVTLSRSEAQAVAGLLRAARPHLPSPVAVDQAIGLLRGDR